ncbi:MAG: HmuY family protein [Saprospiraceae bacterium]|nr:T9SS type A sorting domain-containing protein [Lewinella sp.]
MMKKIQLSLLLFSLAHLAGAQIDQISVGVGYANAAFYSLHDGSVTSIAHTDWDIAFSVGAQDLGIFVNEGIASAMEPLPQVELYLSTSTDFSSVDTSDLQRIYNDEVSWTAGAFNHVATPGDPFDFGWGAYDLNTHTVNGTRVFVIKLRDGAYKKLLIESLISGTYTFKYADLDGTNEVVQSVIKSDFTGKTLAYYHFETNEVLDLEPVSWDLLFTRYVTPLDDGEGGILDYTVTGVLSNAGVQVAKVSGIDPLTIRYEDYDGPFADSLTAIGYDWKAFDLSTFQWSVPEDVVYFVQTADSSIWKVQFLDFEGSTTGVSTLEKTFQTSLVSSTNELPDYVPAFRLYPNPAVDHAIIDLELDQSSRLPASISVFNVSGQQLYRASISLYNGSNRIELPADRLAAGTYMINIQIGTDRIVRRLIVN